MTKKKAATAKNEIAARLRRSWETPHHDAKEEDLLGGPLPAAPPAPVVDRGPWMQTASGRAFYPLDPRPEDITPEDIAHALSHQCRFSGACREHYSVAQHCVLASYAIAPLPRDLLTAIVGGWAESEADALRLYQLAALTHDAHEAFVVDMPRPLKVALRGAAKTSAYDRVELEVQTAACRRLGVPLALVHADCVHVVDDRMLMTEKRDLMAPPPGPWTTTTEPYAFAIEPIAPAEARAQWLARYAELGGRP